MSTNTKKQSEKHTPASVEAKLSRHRMLMEDINVKTRNPEFFERVGHILDHERSSPVHPSESQLFNTDAETYKNHEATFLAHIVPYIIEHSYTPSEASRLIIKEQDKQYQEAGERERESLNDAKAEIRRFGLDGMSFAVDAECKRNIVPARDDNLDIVEKDSENSWGLENPKNDRVFGYHSGKLGRLYDDENMKLNDEIASLCEIVDRVNHPFFLIEGKQAAGNTTEMRDQARKAAATYITATHKLRSHAGLSNDGCDPKKPGTGIDMNTFIFTSTLSAEAFKVYVNFAEIGQDKRPTFHMNLLRQVFVNDSQAKTLSKRWGHNIIEWGLWTRRPEINTMREALFEHQRGKKAKT